MNDVQIKIIWNIKNTHIWEATLMFAIPPKKLLIIYHEILFFFFFLSPDWLIKKIASPWL